jgi:hypothetical protein
VDKPLHSEITQLLRGHCAGIVTWRCVAALPRSEAPTDVLIDGNVPVHGTGGTAATFSGVSGTDPTLRVKFINNTVQGGGIGAVNAQDVIVANNTIVAGLRVTAF